MQYILLTCIYIYIYTYIYIYIYTYIIDTARWRFIEKLVPLFLSFSLFLRKPTVRPASSPLFLLPISLSLSLSHLLRKHTLPLVLGSEANLAISRDEPRTILHRCLSGNNDRDTSTPHALEVSYKIVRCNAFICVES